MPNCYDLTKSITNDCDNPMVPGADAKIWVFPKNVWDNAAKTVDGTDSNLITGIVLASGETGIYIKGLNSSVEPSIELSVGTYGTTYIHSVTFKVFDNSNPVKAELEKLTKGKFVIVVQNNFKGAGNDVTFEIYGYNSGLRALEGGRVVNDTDTLGGYSFTLSSEETATEPRMPFGCLDNDYDTTLTLLNSIVTATVA